MLIAINNTVTRDYSLKADTSDTKTIFRLGTFDSFVRAKLEVGIGGKIQDEERATWFLLDTVRYGLKGWTNFKDDAGNDVPFVTVKTTVPNVGEREIVSDESLMKLKLDWISEIASEIIRDNFLTRQDQKN